MLIAYILLNLKIKATIYTAMCASYLDPHLEISCEGRLRMTHLGQERIIQFDFCELSI